MSGHPEAHRIERVAWLRAAVLGADDGIVSVSSLLLGVAASGASAQTLLIAGFAGLMAGAASMATGEYVSVSSQRDSEAADIQRERSEQISQPAVEFEELKQIYIGRGLDEPLAHQVTARLMEVDPLGTHLRDELGLTEETRARPLQAALVSALSFACGSVLPLGVAWLLRPPYLMGGIALSALTLLAALGALGGKLGGASPWKAALRVCLGGGLAMTATTLVGRLMGVAGL